MVMQYQSLGRRGGESKVCADAGYIVYREILLIFLIAGNRCDWRLILHREARLTEAIGKSDGYVKQWELQIRHLYEKPNQRFLKFFSYPVF